MSALAEAGISEDTLEAIAKAQTAGITSQTGIVNYDLSDLVSLIPVVTPFRDIVAREKSPAGAKFAVWRALMNVTASQPDPAIPLDFAANEVQFSEQDFQASYKKTGLFGSVTQDAYDLAEGYADPYSIATFQTLNQVLIGDDRKLLGAQSFALKASSAPVLTQQASGGTITNVEVYVGVAARTISGYFYGSGNSQGASQHTTFSGGSANSVLAATTAVRGAVLYDWFQSADGATWYYYTSTPTNTVTMTKVITTNQALPNLPDLTTLWKGNAGVPTYNASQDNGSANEADYDGFLSSLSGDYNATGQWVQPGTGTGNPSVWNSLDGAALTLEGGSIAEIQEYIFLALWQQVKCSPTAIMVNATEAQSIADLILSQPSAVTYLQTDENGRVNITAGSRIGSLINTAAGGIPVPIDVHVSLPPGTIIGRTDRVPFPQANIKSVLAYRNLRDMSQFDYGISRIANTAGGGPRRDFEIDSLGAFANRAPVAMAAISNVG